MEEKNIIFLKSLKQINRDFTERGDVETSQGVDIPDFRQLTQPLAPKLLGTPRALDQKPVQALDCHFRTPPVGGRSREREVVSEGEKEEGVSESSVRFLS